MKIATWNVNSIRTRLESLETWVQQSMPDVIAFQETKVTDDLFPTEWFEERGYHVIAHGQKSYNGVAVCSKVPISDPITKWPDFPDEQARFLQVKLPNDCLLLNVYVPNGQSLESDKYKYKLHWLEALRKHIQTMNLAEQKLILLGDFNIAPSDIDVHDVAAWQDKVLVSPPEREAYQQLVELGLVDSYRTVYPEQPGFTWWDYRQAAWRRDRGVRIDLILVSQALWPQCRYITIDRDIRGLERPSDHVPVCIEVS